MKRDAIARLFYAYMALFIAVSAFSAPCSAMSAMLLRNGFWGYAVTCGMSVLAVVTVADVVLNDWFPNKCKFHWAKAHRHWLYAVTAGAYITPLFSASATWVTAAQFIFYIGMALFGLVLGYREVQARRGLMCDE